MSAAENARSSWFERTDRGEDGKAEKRKAEDVDVPEVEPRLGGGEQHG